MSSPPFALFRGLSPPLPEGSACHEVRFDAGDVGAAARSATSKRIHTGVCGRVRGFNGEEIRQRDKSRKGSSPQQKMLKPLKCALPRALRRVQQDVATTQSIHLHAN